MCVPIGDKDKAQAADGNEIARKQCNSGERTKRNTTKA